MKTKVNKISDVTATVVACMCGLFAFFTIVGMKMSQSAATNVWKTFGAGLDVSAMALVGCLLVAAGVYIAVFIVVFSVLWVVKFLGTKLTDKKTEPTVA